MSKLKLCFSTLPCLDSSVYELRALCEKHKIDGVEIRVDGVDVPECIYGLNIVNLGTSLCFLGYEEEKIRAAKEILSKIEQTKIRAVRVFLGNFAVMKTAAKNKIDYGGIVRALREVADSTEKEIWIETHNEFSTGRILKMLSDDVKRDNVKFIWDVVHPIEDFEEPHQTWEYIGDRIAHIHLKDARPPENPLKHDWDYTLLGEGELPLKNILKLLCEKGFSGYVSFEWENRWRKELEKYSSDIDTVLGWFTEFMNDKADRQNSEECEK